MKNFLNNISPLIGKVREMMNDYWIKFTEEEMNLLVQFYLEVLTQPYATKHIKFRNFLIKIKPIMIKLQNKENLYCNELGKLWELYLYVNAEESKIK
jgi:hypothetical protein